MNIDIFDVTTTSEPATVDTSFIFYATIAGGVIFVVILLVVICVCIRVALMNRRKRRQDGPEDDVTLKLTSEAVEDRERGRYIRAPIPGDAQPPPLIQNQLMSDLKRLQKEKHLATDSNND